MEPTHCRGLRSIMQPSILESMERKSFAPMHCSVAQCLDNLTDHGVLEKVPYSDHPPRHEYRLTAKGQDLSPVVTTMRQWGDKYAAPDGPPVQLVHERCGTVFHAEMTCSNCGELVPAREVRVVPGPGDLDRLLDIRGKHPPKSKEPTNTEQE